MFSTALRCRRCATTSQALIEWQSCWVWHKPRQCVCLSSFVGLTELMYRVWRDECAALAHLAYDQCLALPITWIHESPELLKAAAAIKAKHLLSLADAWIAATAELNRATLLHRDPEFAPLAVYQELLSLKTSKPKKATAAVRRS